MALWSWHVDTDMLTLDEKAYALWGIPPEGHVTFEDLSAHIHPADRDRVRSAFAATRAILGHYEIDFRIWSAMKSGGVWRGAREKTWGWSVGSCSEFPGCDRP